MSKSDNAKVTQLKHQLKNKVTPFHSSLLNVIEPVINQLDKYSLTSEGEDAGTGHELPSRKDGMLRILISNFCRDVYQQIHGVNTDNYKFSGVKDNWDRAQTALAQLVTRYANSPEDMEMDPNCSKFMIWYETASAKMEMLNELLDSLETVYYSVTGDKWEYKAPGQAKAAKISGADAAAIIRKRYDQAIAAKRGELTDISNNSQLIKKEQRSA